MKWLGIFTLRGKLARLMHSDKAVAVSDGKSRKKDRHTMKKAISTLTAVAFTLGLAGLGFSQSAQPVAKPADKPAVTTAASQAAPQVTPVPDKPVKPEDKPVTQEKAVQKPEEKGKEQTQKAGKTEAKKVTGKDPKKTEAGKSGEKDIVKEEVKK
jgi:hypothetical protein